MMVGKFKDLEIIPEGTLIVVTNGTYSDYRISAIGRATKDINANSLREEWIRLYPDQIGEYKFQETDFLAWVVTKGLIEELVYWEWHLSDYSRIDEMEIIKGE